VAVGFKLKGSRAETVETYIEVG